jgi:hypothetical protein
MNFKEQMARTVAIIVTLLISAVSATAQVQRKCQVVTDSSERLACYDRAFPPAQVRSRQPAKPALTLKNVDLNTLCRPKEIVERIRSIAPQKSEFETQIEFEKRFQSSIVRDEFVSRDLVCEVSRPHLKRYKAEAQAYEISTLGVFEAHEEQTGSYQSSNAFGASVNIVKKDAWWWEIDGTYLGSIQIPMSRTEAERRQNKFQVAVVGSLRSPFFKEEVYTSSPTFRNPEEIKRVTRKLFMKTRYIIAFDSANGEVFWSSPINLCKNEANGVIVPRIGSCSIGFQ